MEEPASRQPDIGVLDDGEEEHWGEGGDAVSEVHKHAQLNGADRVSVYRQQRT